MNGNSVPLGSKTEMYSSQSPRKTDSSPGQDHLREPDQASRLVRRLTAIGFFTLLTMLVIAGLLSLIADPRE